MCICKILNAITAFMQANQQMSKLINSNNLIPYDSDCIYYLVREGYVSDPASFTWRAEGTCKKIRFISEMVDGSI